MDFRDSPEEAAFRDRLRGWLSEQKGKFPTSGDAYWAKAGEWHQALFGAGFFGTSWPKEYGGQDLPPVYDVIVDEEIAKAGARRGRASVISSSVSVTTAVRNSGSGSCPA